MGCLVCGSFHAERHHVISRGAYGRNKNGYDHIDNVWNLCHNHHMEFHTIGALTFAKKYGKELEYLCAKDVFNQWNIKHNKIGGDL